jgi:hypothetical protein
MKRFTITALITVILVTVVGWLLFPYVSTFAWQFAGPMRNPVAAAKAASVVIYGRYTRQGDHFVFTIDEVWKAGDADRSWFPVGKHLRSMEIPIHHQMLDLDAGIGYFRSSERESDGSPKCLGDYAVYEGRITANGMSIDEYKRVCGFDTIDNSTSPVRAAK